MPHELLFLGIDELSFDLAVMMHARYADGSPAPGEDKKEYVQMTPKEFFELFPGA